ncbi:MAG: preprotein translocase subunit SecA [Planctomycetota bacterium]
MDWDSLSDKFSHFGENVGRSLKNLFGARNERLVRGLEPLVREINALEGWAKSLSAEDFPKETATLKAAIAKGEAQLDDVLPKAFALAREASVRTLGMRHFDVQLVGGIVLHRGSIAEMMTGEGKTLVATLPLYLNALSGRTVCLVTVNDYLAKRDAEWMGPIYEYLGMQVGYIQSDMNPWERQPVYACDIVYGTNNEFGFDYLRDNMKQRVEDQVQRDLYYAIVDEVDSILIDEARTPLIISGSVENTADKYKIADDVACKLVRDVHYEVKEKERSASLLEAGIEEAERMVGVESFFAPPNEDWPHYIENALRAHALYRKDKEYVVEPGEQGVEVVIVDEFTGRKMHGRRWSDGLHQAVETKEGLKPRQETQTLATITFQNYFRMYKKLAGMTGTAITEAGEFHKIYKLDVVNVPTNLPLARDDGDDIVYRTEKEKWTAIVDEIARVHEKGQPVLVGTTSIEKSEVLSGHLNRRGIPHSVLNAKNHAKEATIIALAGEKGQVTVATNMAGRGTDIKLGGNFEHRLNKALEEAGITPGDLSHLDAIARIRAEVRARCDKDEAEVQSLGGLYVLGTERHEARRIDNQLRGRSGRQGNAGESRFYLSLQDDLMRIFYRDWVTNAMERLGMSEGVPIESGMVSRAIARAQKKVEDRNFEIRKSLLEYDEVMDQQRKTVYGVRQEVLESKGLKEKVIEMVGAVVNRSAQQTYLQDAEGFRGWFLRTFGFELDEKIAGDAVAKGGNPQGVLDLVLAQYEKREAEFKPELMRQIERYVLLDAIDSRWKDHLHAIDSLKAGIGLRGYGQVDPKNEYKREGFQLFQNLLHAIEDQVAGLVLRIRVSTEPPPQAQRVAPAQPAAAALPLTSGNPASASAAAPAPARPPARRPPMAPTMVPASRAFDVARRMQQMQAAQQAQAAKSAETSDGAHTAEAASETPAGAANAEPQASPAPASTQAPTRAQAVASTQTRTSAPMPGRASAAGRAAEAELRAKFATTGRNDPCPCGSGQKFKKCHGPGA